MKAIFLRLILVLAALGAFSLAMIFLGPWAFMLSDFAPPSSQAAALADLDGDGDLDAFLANRKSEHTTYNTVWVNLGGSQGGRPGDFADSGQRLGAAEFLSVALGDLDADGDIDALVNTVLSLNLFLNLGGRQGGASGALKQDRVLELNEDWIGFQIVTLGDLDGDGDLDAFVGGCCGTVAFMAQGEREWWPSHHTVWLNKAPEQLFQDTGQRLGTDGTQGIALGDLDGDGDLDAFAANASAVVDTEGNELRNQPDRVWLNDGTGIFSDSGQRLGDDDGRSVALGDLDGDGDLDAFIGSDALNYVWLNDGMGHFVDSGQRLGDSRNRAVFLGDLDGDGDLDALDAGQETAKIWLNDGRGAFTLSGVRLAFGSRFAVALGDVDGDGDLDVFAGWLAEAYRVWFNDGKAQFQTGP